MDKQFDQKILFELLRDIDQAEISGAFTISAGDYIFHIYFQVGYVVFALGVVASSQQTLELNRQQTLLLFGHLTEGIYKFDGTAEPPKHLDWRLRAADLIMEAARLMDDEDKLRAAIGDLSQTVGPIFNLEERAQGLLLSKVEVEVMGQLEAAISIQELIGRLGRPELETLRALYALLLAGVLDLPQAPSSPGELGNDSAISPSPSEPTTAAPAQREAEGKLPQAAQPVSPPVAKQATSPAHHKSSSGPPMAKLEAMPKHLSKLNTGALEKLAGVKIRSTGSRSEQESTGSTESEKYFRQGCAALKVGNIAGAEAFLRKALSLAPGHLTYMLWLGRLLAKLPKKRKEAEGLLMQACSNDPEAIEPRLELAELYKSLGMKTKAETLLKSVLKIDPNHKGAQTRLAALGRS